MCRTAPSQDLPEPSCHSSPCWQPALVQAPRLSPLGYTSSVLTSPLLPRRLPFPWLWSFSTQQSACCYNIYIRASVSSPSPAPRWRHGSCHSCCSPQAPPALVQPISELRATASLTVRVPTLPPSSKLLGRCPNTPVWLDWMVGLQEGNEG